MKYKARFIGRKVGAIGTRYAIDTTVEADNPEDARIKLYDTYEHISGLTLEVIEEVTP